MNLDQQESHTKTITNPKLSNIHINTERRVQLTQNLQHTPFNSPHQSEEKKVDVYQDSHMKPRSLRVQFTKAYESPEIHKQDFEVKCEAEQMPFRQLCQQDSMPVINKENASKRTFIKEEQPIFSQIQKQNPTHSIQNNRNVSQKRTFLNCLQQKPVRQNSNVLKNTHFTRNTNKNSAADHAFVIQDDFILAGSDLNRDEIVLTIEQRVVKPLNNDQTQLDNDQQREIVQQNSNKMEIQNQQEAAFRDNENFEKKSNFKQIVLPLKGYHDIKRLRHLAPIKSLKNYILSQFGYNRGLRNGKIMSICFYNLYQSQSPQIILPITNQQNLEIILTEYIKAHRDIYIRFEHDGTLRKKTVWSKENKFQVQFDSDGQLEDDDENDQNLDSNEVPIDQQDDVQNIKKMIKVNKTQKDKYKGTNVVRCAFCHKNTKDINSIKTSGPFYGPFFVGKTKTKKYCHLLCALWCKKVFLNDENQLKQIPQEMNRSQNKRCLYCQESGAGLQCQKGCGSMHYECGLGRCEYIWSRYEVYCEKCAQKRKKQAQQSQSQDEELESKQEDKQKKRQNGAQKDTQKNSEEENRQQSPQNQPMQIEQNEPQKPLPNSFNIQQPDQSHELIIKYEQALEKALQFTQPQNMSLISPAHSERQYSRTQSIPNANRKENVQQEKRQMLEIDESSRIEVQGQNFQQAQEQVEVLEKMCKPARQKMSMVKIEEPELMHKKEPARRRKAKSGSNKK